MYWIKMTSYINSFLHVIIIKHVYTTQINGLVHAILIISERETTTLIKCHKFYSAWCFSRDFHIALNHLYIFLFNSCSLQLLLSTSIWWHTVHRYVYTLIMDMTFKWCRRSRKHEKREEKMEWNCCCFIKRTRFWDYDG